MTCSIIKSVVHLAVIDRDITSYLCETHDQPVKEGDTLCWLGRYDADVQTRIDEAVVKTEAKLQAAVAEINAQIAPVDLPGLGIKT